MSKTTYRISFATFFATIGFLSLVEAHAAGDQITFEETILDENPLANNRINDIAVADIDGDGRPDIWLSGRDAPHHQSGWYKNPGDRHSAWARSTFSKGSWKYGDLGDVDGDGDIDIVAGYNSEKKVYWVENSGSPTKDGWQKNDLGISGAPDQIFVRDLNADSAMEIVAFYKNGPIAILRRPHDPRQRWSVTQVARRARGTAGGTIGDVDNDGDLDIVFGNSWYENPAPSGGDWTVGKNWKRRTIDPNWPHEARSVVADIDSDGRNDIVLSGEESSDGIAWYRTPDPHRNVAWERVAVSRTPYVGVHSLQAADFDGDGRLDIFAAEMHTSKERRVTVFLQGNDPKQWVERIVARTGSHNAKVTDLNGDGIPDIVGKNFEGDMRPRIWFTSRVDRKAEATRPNAAPTAMKRHTTLPLNRWRRHVIANNLPHKATFIRVGDLDGDGKPDLAAGAWWWPNPGKPGGTWRPKTFGANLSNVAVLYDFDGDNDLDVLGTNGKVHGNVFFWAKNSGRGEFTIHGVGPPADGDFLQGAKVAHLRNGKLQVVLSWHNGHRTNPKKGTQWYEVPSDPMLPWTWRKIHSFSNEEELDIGDIDMDGRRDIHLGSHWLRNLGNGKFELVEALKLAKGDVDRIRVADIDGDKDDDVVIGAEHAKILAWGENPGPNDTSLWKIHIIATDFLHMSLDVGDVDGDGDLDVVSGAHGGGGLVRLYENGGAGKNWIPHTVDKGRRDIDHHAGTQLVDLDGDGDLDIVSIGWRHTTLTIYENGAILPAN